MTYYLLLLCISSFSCLYFFRKYALKKRLLDTPNQRSLHNTPTPRGGGIVFISLWILYATGFTLLSNWPLLQSIALLPPVLILAIVSFLDDKINLSAKWRFLVHLTTAFYFLITIGGFFVIDLGFIHFTSFILLTIFALFFIVWSINLFNFMDGSDGLAASEAIFIFLVAGFLLLHFQVEALAYLCFAMIAVVSGFLVWNWPPAKIFMGDVGSTCLGFLIAAIAILAQKYYEMPILLWLMLYGLFLFDATITLIRRMLKGEKWRESHRSHAYQRLVLSGWNHWQVLKASLFCNIVILGLVILATIWIKWAIVFMLIEYLGLALVYYKIEKIYPMPS